MNGKTLILALLVVTGIYLLPSVTAKFAGSHTMEKGAGNASSMSCGACHSYVADELNATLTKTASVIAAHRLAYSTGEYANSSNASAPLRIPKGSSETGTIDSTTKVCLLCHLAQGSGITGSHTQVTTRVCTDSACHGYKTGSGTVLVYPGQNITEKLRSPLDGHSVWLNAMTSNSTYPAQDVDGYTSDFANQSYVNTASGNYTIAFYTCLGCHTHVGVKFNITRNTQFNLSVVFTTNATLSSVTYEGSGADINAGNATVVAYKYFGSVW